MCGIAGILGPGSPALIAAMAGILAHRGPDGDGFWQDEQESVFLGHRRLAVLDIAGGIQPMWNGDETIGVVFNGEIYNHHDLRRELVERGHVFRSDHSDTEVLVHGYAEWGDALPERLNGMFAFAIVDRRRRRIFLARDPFGKKPLFYTDQPGLFAFASEIDALLLHPDLDSEPDRQGLKKFFAYGFFPAPFTPYRAIRKLPGGHRMTVDLKSRKTKIERYWAFRIEPGDPPPGGPSAWADELRHLLSEAVKRRLESDVPMGILLSGGIDSSTILALASEHIPKDEIHSYGMGFDEASFDESGPARTVADHIGVHHHAEKCSLDSARSELDSLLDRLDEPLGDSSILPTFLVSRFARRDVTVALSGDGGDEMFAGYDPFQALGPTTLYARLVPPSLHGLLQRMAGLLPRSDRNLSFDFKVRRWLRGANQRPALWNPMWMGALDPEEISELFGEATTAEDLYSEAISQWEGRASNNPIDRTLEFFTNFYLQDDILVKADRASMLVSLEVRSPFLDRDLVDFARRLPADMKYRGGQRKYLLKRAVRDLLPGEIISRPKKGFGIPLTAWLRDMPAPAKGVVPFIDEDWLARRWEQHRTGQADHRHALWCWKALHHRFARVPQPVAA